MEGSRFGKGDIKSTTDFSDRTVDQWGTIMSSEDDGLFHATLWVGKDMQLEERTKCRGFSRDGDVVSAFQLPRLLGSIWETRQVSRSSRELMIVPIYMKSDGRRS